MTASGEGDQSPAEPPDRHLWIAPSPIGAGAEVLLGHDVRNGEDVWLPDEVRPRGVTVIGKTGFGKTTLLEHLILADLRAGTPVIVFDVHGDLTRRIVTLAPKSALDRLVLLEAWEDTPFRLNLFDCPDAHSRLAVDRTVDAVVAVFKKLFGDPTEYAPRLERDLGNAARTVIANNGTLLDISRLFWDEPLRRSYLARVTNRHVHEFWAYYDRLGRESERARQLEATVNRLDRFLSSELVQEIVNTRESTIPFEAVLAGHASLLVSLPIGVIGELLSGFLGALLLTVFTSHVFARAALPVEQRRRVHLYLDEYHRFATPATAQLLTEGRKFGLGVTLTHQTLAQIPDDANRAAERQVGALVLFQSIGPDAEELAGELDTTPVRTKKVARQRMEPKYREWDEPVWDDPAREREYEGLQAELDHLTETVGKALARRHAEYCILQSAYTRWYLGGQGPGPGFETLVSSNAAEGVNSCGTFNIHAPFNPCNLRAVLPGQTIGGVRKKGQPDFWAWQVLERDRHLDCEGYMLRQEGVVHWPALTEVRAVPKLRSWLSYYLLEMLNYGGEEELARAHGLEPELNRCAVFLADLSMTRSQLGLMFQSYLGWVPDSRNLLSREELRDIAMDLDRQVSALHEQYQAAIFWFFPRIEPYSGLSWEKNSAWLAENRAGLGQERPVRIHDADTTMRGYHNYQWPKLGRWQVTAFPQAVAWLRQWVRDAQRDIAELKAQWEAGRQSVEQRRSDLVEKHRKTVHRKEHQGDVPAEKIDIVFGPEPTSELQKQALLRRKGVLVPDATVSKQPWYDQVEELDQTHADRRLELANELVQLPPFTAYCRTATTQHHVALNPLVKTDIDEARIERLRQVSKSRFGRPPEEPPAPPVVPEGPDGGPAGLRIIARERPDEE